MTHRFTMTALLVALCAYQAHGQAAPADDSRIEQLEKRFNEQQKKYEQDLRARDTKIEALTDEVAQLKGRKAAEDKAKRQAHDAAVNDLLKEIDSGKTVEPTERKGVSFNPDFAVISDFLGTWSNDRDNDARNRFDVREVELDLRAAVDPRADAVLILAFARDVEDPVFEAEEAEGPETSVEVEEAYLHLHDFGVPNLTAKIGRFHLRFGRQNILHLHNLPTSDPSLMVQSFLAPEALTDAGVSLSYLVPNPWNQYIEVVTEVITGEGSGAESPTLNGDVRIDSPGVNVHVLWNVDLSDTWNLELGGSYLHGQRDLGDEDDPDRRGDANLFGADVTLIHTDPTGGFNNLLIQGEAIYGLVDQPGDTSRGWGAYILAQQQLHKDWYVGVRLDWTENANDENQEVWAASPYVSWYWSELLRFRAEYQHRAGDVDDADILFFQITWVFGAHPPHPYWAMR